MHVTGFGGPPQSWGDCSRKTRYAWPGWARASHSHSGGLARSFSWKGSRRRHSPRLCSSIAGSSMVLTGSSSGLGFLLGCRPCLAALHRAPAATSITRPAVMAAPTRMSPWRRKKLIPARGPWPHPACPSGLHCTHKVPHVPHTITTALRGETWSCGVLLQEGQHLPCCPPEILMATSGAEHLSQTSIPKKYLRPRASLQEQHRAGATPRGP